MADVFYIEGTYGDDSRDGKRHPTSSTYAMDSGTDTDTVIDSELPSQANDYYNGAFLFNVTRGENRRITDSTYSAGSWTLELVSAITGQTTGDTYYILATWDTIGKANTTLTAGDTVYIMAGTYGEMIGPSNSGASGQYITYSRYLTDSVILNGTAGAFIGATDDYIKMFGIKFDGQNYTSGNWAIDVIGDYVDIDTCEVYDATNTNCGGILQRGDYGHIHHCWIDNIGHAPGFGNGIQLYDENTQYNLIEDNEILRCYHEGISISGAYNIVQNNDCHNTVRRNIGMRGSGGLPNLVQDNIIRDSGELDAGGQPNAGMECEMPYNIIRRNRYYNNDGWGITFYSVAARGPSYVKFYNNVLYNNGTENPSYPFVGEGIGIAGDYEWGGNLAIKNIINYANEDYGIKYWGDYSDASYTIQANNHWEETDGDPKFVNPPSDFELQSSSPCIDNGGWLTTITSATGSGTSFVVDDAGYFCDGWGIIAGDEIQLQGKSSSVTVTDVNYGTDTITVDESVSWTQGDGIALAYNNSAPDQGVYESDYSDATSDDLENRLLAHIFKNTSYSQPGNLYIALCKSTVEDDDTGSTLPSEISGGAYSRKQCNTWDTSGTQGHATNDLTLQFSTATNQWGTITDFAICDATSGGNMLYYGKLSESKNIHTGDIFIISTDDLDIALN